MNKAYEQIVFHNDNVPALNETNLNAISEALNTIDDRVCEMADGVAEYLPKAEEITSHYEQITEDVATTTANAEQTSEDRASATESARRAKISEENAEAIVGIGIATTEKAGIVKGSSYIGIKSDGTLDTDSLKSKMDEYQGNFMRQDETIGRINNTLYDTTERSRTNRAHIDIIQNQIGELKFGIDGEGNRGYFEADDSFVPFSDAEVVASVWGNALNKTSFGAPSGEGGTSFYNTKVCEKLGIAYLKMKKRGRMKVIYTASGYSTTGSTAYGAQSEILLNGVVVGGSTGNQTRIGGLTTEFDVEVDDEVRVYTRGSTTQSGGYTATFFLIKPVPTEEG